VLDEMIDGCRSVLGIPMAGFDSRSLVGNRGTLAFMSEDLKRKPHSKERKRERERARERERERECSEMDTEEIQEAVVCIHFTSYLRQHLPKHTYDTVLWIVDVFYPPYQHVVVCFCL